MPEAGTSTVHISTSSQEGCDDASVEKTVENLKSAIAPSLSHGASTSTSRSVFRTTYTKTNSTSQNLQVSSTTNNNNNNNNKETGKSKKTYTSGDRWNAVVLLQRWFRNWLRTHQAMRLFCMLRLLRLESLGQLYADSKALNTRVGQHSLRDPIGVAWAVVQAAARAAESYDLSLRQENETRCLMIFELEQTNPTWQKANPQSRRVMRASHPSLYRCCVMPKPLMHVILDEALEMFDINLAEVEEEWRVEQQATTAVHRGTAQRNQQMVMEMKSALVEVLGTPYTEYLMQRLAHAGRLGPVVLSKSARGAPKLKKSKKPNFLSSPPATSVLLKGLHLLSERYENEKPTPKNSLVSTSATPSAHSSHTKVTQSSSITEAAASSTTSPHSSVKVTAVPKPLPPPLPVAAPWKTGISRPGDALPEQTIPNSRWDGGETEVPFDWSDPALRPLPLSGPATSSPSQDRTWYSAEKTAMKERCQGHRSPSGHTKKSPARAVSGVEEGPTAGELSDEEDVWLEDTAEEYSEEGYYSKQRQQQHELLTRLKQKLDLPPGHSTASDPFLSSSGATESYPEVELAQGLGEFGRLEDGLQLLGFKRSGATPPSSGPHTVASSKSTLQEEFTQWTNAKSHASQRTGAGEAVRCDGEGKRSPRCGAPSEVRHICAVCELPGRLCLAAAPMGRDGLVGDDERESDEERMVLCHNCSRAVHLECALEPEQAGNLHPAQRFCSTTCVSGICF